jgi:MerR family mercuric resistance operon transcriptional regulator
MVSDLAVPQFGQVMVDSRSIFDSLRIHESEDRQNRAERQDTHQDSRNGRTTARKTRRTGNSPAMPNKHPASAEQRYDGGDEQGGPMRRGHPCNSNQPCATETDRTEQQREGTARSCAECRGQAPDGEHQCARVPYGCTFRWGRFGVICRHLALLIKSGHHAKPCIGYRLKPIRKGCALAEIRIGELSHRTGCNIETIRYYERVGLLPQPPRSPSRYRLYDSDDVRRLTFVRRSRELGFSLDEVRALLTLSAKTGQESCAEVRELADHHLEDIRKKIADLRAMKRVPAESVRRCDAGEALGCPLIDSLLAA